MDIEYFPSPLILKVARLRTERVKFLFFKKPQKFTVFGTGNLTEILKKFSTGNPLNVHTLLPPICYFGNTFNLLNGTAVGKKERKRLTNWLTKKSSFLFADDELGGGGQLRRAGSLRLSRSAEQTDSDNQNNRRTENDHATSNIRVWNRRKNGLAHGSRSDGESRNLLHVPDDNTRSQQQHQQDPSASAASAGGSSAGGSPSRRRPARHSAPATAAPAPEYLARSLLQLGCPVVSMPK